MGITFIVGKNGCHGLNGLRGRSIFVVRMTGSKKYLQFTKFLKFGNFNSKTCSGHLNGFIMLIALCKNI